MKLIKKLFYFIIALILALSIFVLFCAMNPEMSASLAAILYGTDNIEGILTPFLDKENKTDDAPSQTIPGSGTVSDLVSRVEDVAVFPTENGYILPSDSVVKLPDSVGGKSGYLPVRESSGVVTDQNAESIGESLSVGKTGEDYSFDSTFYPYYQMLNDNQKSLYKQIYANSLDLLTSFAPCVKIDSSDAKDTFEAVINDHPELFFVEPAYSIQYKKDGEVVKIDLSYYTIANKIGSAKEEFETAANAIISAASKLEDPYETEKYVHDALVSKISYSEQAPMNQSAYSALVGGETVCAGYARAFQYIMMNLGIPCYYCTGFSGEDHAWNIIALSDGYYNVDVTWDDTDPATYDYFNKSDRDYSGTHVRTSLSVNLPACEGSIYSNREKAAPEQIELPQTADATEGISEAGGSSVINPNPTKPLRYEDEKREEPREEEKKDDATLLAEALAALGLKETDVIWDLDSYYADCKKQMIAGGVGQQHFVSIVPKSLFDKIEQEYGKRSHVSAYVTDALKTLKVENFALQIQAEAMGDSYYKLYHNVVTW